MLKRNIEILIAGGLLILAACTSIPPISELPESIANATTAADHQRLS